MPAPEAPAKLTLLKAGADAAFPQALDPAALGAVRDVLCLVDADFKIRFVNPAAERLTKRPAAWLLGGDVWTLFPNAVGTVFQAQSQRAMRERTAVSFDFLGTAGSWLEVRLLPSGDGLLFCITDVTEVRRLLADRDTLFELSRDLFAEFQDGAVVRVNPAWEKVLGWTAADLLGKPITRFTHPDDLPRTLEETLRIRGGTSSGQPFENRIRGKDGTYRWISWSSVHDGSRGFGIGRDVTERKQIETRLMVSDRMASVGTLAAGVAHEINNPLAFVLANLDFAARQLDELAAGGVAESKLTELRSVVSDAREGADRVRAIVRDLKSFSRSDEPKPGPVDLHRVLDSCCSMAWNEIRHRARLEKAYHRGGRQALGTEPRLSQVFLNLLVNAAQAIPEGAASSHVIRVATSSLEDGRLAVSISDTGPGMPAEVMSHIFEPFFTTKPVGVGTGLGLSICHGIVQELGGEIRVESALGKGTTFHVVLRSS